MRNIVHDYFVNLFTSEVGDHDPAILSDVNRCVSEDMNTGLLAPFSYEEVKNALFQIGDLKAPGQMACTWWILGSVGGYFGV